VRNKEDGGDAGGSGDEHLLDENDDYVDEDRNGHSGQGSHHEAEVNNRLADDGT